MHPTPALSTYLQQTDLSSLPSDGVAFLEHLFGRIDYHISQWGKILLLALTKKSSEEITNFLVWRGYKAYYLHSEIATTDRREIIKKLRTGVIDILVWVNLLREGIDLPEVSLIAILDADKEWFLRSTTSLVQIIGRAARNPNGEVILYADRFTQSIVTSLFETYRRRTIQIAHNQAHGIVPSQAISNIKKLDSVKTGDDLTQTFDAITVHDKVKRLKRMTKKEKEMIEKNLIQQLETAIAARDFETAATVRDQLKDLRGE